MTGPTALRAPLRVLYIGLKTGQSLLMRQALERRGHEVFHVDPYAVHGQSRILNAWSWRTGALGTSKLAERHVRREVGERRFDVAFVDNGEMVSAEAVRYLHTRARRVALFNRDNPFVPRDGLRWRVLLDALPLYDLYVTRRVSTAERARQFGARSVMHTTLFADETLHTPAPPSPDEFRRYGSPVSFVGSWFPERGPFMETLVRLGVPLRIVGHRWSRASNFKTFQHVVVPGYLNSHQYSAAVRSSQIAVGMLSKGNEDLHTARSLEIPAMGVVLCAERTSEHLEMYREGEEAIFWSSAEECASLCLELLRDVNRLKRIADAGRARVLASRNWTEPVMEQILAAALAVER